MLTAEMAIQPARDKHGSGMVAESRSYMGFLLCYNQACSSHTYSINRHTKHTMRNDHALITGGGSGIGLATARRFREDNFKVTILDVVDPSSVAQKIGAESITLDVQDESLIEELAIHLTADTPPVSVLVTCAGPLQRHHRHCGGAGSTTGIARPIGAGRSHGDPGGPGWRGSATDADRPRGAGLLTARAGGGALRATVERPVGLISRIFCSGDEF